MKALPAGRWKGLVADREFIGGEWFRFLKRKRIKRAIRIRKNAIIDELRVDEWFGDLKVGEVRLLVSGSWYARFVEPGEYASRIRLAEEPPLDD
ncbi:hypothetical protein [Deinococcus sp. QL22]|uniref:hypothetical protein n=1 Tax=Deinococcus sp. QL22 TaxID=2939437 RepID=UPI0020175D51|nr:hypothetical protein [Deinococcus sp. QL22]UQN08488.1 hypothetical protein M1R55_17410 [Deinococcus sp. QL22]